MNTLQDAIFDFLRHCKFEKQLTAKTLKAYLLDLEQLRTFLASKNRPTALTEITKAELREYLESITHLKPRTIKRKIASVKAFFNYLEFEDWLAISPFRKMRIRIRESKVIPRVMDLREVSKIFRAAYREKNTKRDVSAYAYFESVRDIVVIELLFTTGGRVSEIANLEDKSINLNSGSVTIKGKGNKERIIHICNKESIAILTDYRRLCLERQITAGGYFLVNRSSKKLSDQSIRNVVKKLSQKAGITRQITPHVFRHSFATLLLENDVDIKYIQSLLGHSSIVTTQIYTHVNRAKQRKILKAKHPRKDFCMTGVNAG
jgi:integrase/recombinase XerD